MKNPLNSAAGSVPFPDDPKEIAAALKASRVLWRAYPYLGFRWGVSGQRFGHSDCAYYLTLMGYDQKTIDRQVFWVAEMLSQRGLPSLLVEQQLPILARFAGHAMCNPARYQPLCITASRLQERRTSILEPGDHAHIADTFAKNAGFPAHRIARGTGLLIASAAADEAAGVKNAVASLAEWFENPNVFDRHWISAVRDATSTARGLVRIRKKTNGPPAR